MPKSYYEIFEIPNTASADEIKISYRKLAIKFHPDKNLNKGFSESKMKEINFIYSILSNPTKKREYDNSIAFDFFYDESNYKSNSVFDIYCNEISVTDSKGRKSKLKIGDNIYYQVDIDSSIITWKYKKVEYFDVVVKNIFDSIHKEDFSKVVKFDNRKTPLCIVYWGVSEMIVYKEDFEIYWLNHKSFSLIDRQKGILTTIVILCLLCFGGYNYYLKFNLSQKEQEALELKYDKSKSEIKELTQYYKVEYLATDAEINYILTDYYTICAKEFSLIKKKTNVRNIPSSIGLVIGEVKEGEKVLILLYCPSLEKYKIKYKNITGWIGTSKLENPKCY